MERGSSRMIHTGKLSNGIRVVCEETPYFRSVSFGVFVETGSAYENVKNNGIAHVIEHMLFKGTKNRSARQIADEMSAIGGNLDAYTSKESTSYYTRTLDTHFDKAVDIISDMIHNSLIREEDLEKEKGVILEEIDMYEDSAEDLVHEMLQKEVWKEHPLGYIISGDKENVRRFTREEICKFMEEHYVGDKMLISVAGNINTSRVMQFLEEKFGDIRQVGKGEKLTRPEYRKTFYSRHKEIEQAHLDLAFPSIPYHSGERYVLAVLNSVLGGSINSRLFQKIREEKGYAYTIYSYGSSYKEAGLLQIYAATNPRQMKKMVESIYQIVQELKQKGVSYAELARIKEELKTELIIGTESSKTKMNNNAKALLQYGRIVPLEEDLKKLEEVTTEDVAFYAKKFLNLSESSMAVVGNRKEIPLEEIEEIWRNWSEQCTK
jgi:predicted Zn-dependent peptidase